MVNLRDKVLNAHHPVIFYEITPPQEKAKASNAEAYIQCAVELIDSSPIVIDGINIPDLRDEQYVGLRNSSYAPKSDGRVFGKKLQESSHKSPEIVINRCTVFDPLPDHNRWIEETVERFGITNLVLVGAPEPLKTYPGPSVQEFTQILKTSYPDQLFCGGIVIPSRPQEASLLIEKGLKGSNFFISQILYEPYLIKKVLREYHQLCKEKGHTPKRIFLSFAPISSQKDLDFLRWLGVILPEAVEKILFEADIGIGWRSLKVAKAVLNYLLQFMHDEKIKVPLGLNIEHIARHNFELSKEFVEELGAIYTHSFETKYNIFD